VNAVPGAARRRRTAGIGAIAVAAALLTSSCAAGRVAQTIRQRPAIDGVNAQVGSIAVRYVSIEAPSHGTSYPKGSALRLTGVFVNNGRSTDLLTNISSASATGWGAYSSVTGGDQVVAAAAASAAGVSAPTSTAASTSAPAAGSTAAAPQASQTVRIPAQSRASYGVPDATGSLLVLGTKIKIYPGSTISLTLTFARAGTVTVQVPVQVDTNPKQASVPAPSSSAEGN
jgi:hypothetical protein